MAMERRGNKRLAGSSTRCQMCSRTHRSCHVGNLHFYHSEYTSAKCDLTTNNVVTFAGMQLASGETPIHHQRRVSRMGARREIREQEIFHHIPNAICRQMATVSP